MLFVFSIRIFLFSQKKPVYFRRASSARRGERDLRDMAAQHAVIAMQIPELHPSPGTFELMRPGGGPLASLHPL